MAAAWGMSHGASPNLSSLHALGVQAALSPDLEDPGTHRLMGNLHCWHSRRARCIWQQICRVHPLQPPRKVPLHCASCIPPSPSLDAARPAVMSSFAILPSIHIQSQNTISVLACVVPTHCTYYTTGKVWIGRHHNAKSGLSLQCRQQKDYRAVIYANHLSLSQLASLRTLVMTDTGYV